MRIFSEAEIMRGGTINSLDSLIRDSETTSYSDNVTRTMGSLIGESHTTNGGPPRLHVR